MQTAVLIFATFACLAVRAQPQQFQLDVDVPIFVTHPTNYLSYTIDSYGIVYWSAYVEAVFGNPLAVALASHLSPVFFRFGGTEADNIIYDMDQSRETQKGFSWTYMNQTQWDAVNQFAVAAGAQLVFTVNALTRNKNGSWNASNLIELLTYTSQKGFNVYAWELGNEPDIYPSKWNVTVTPQQLAADYQLFRSTLNNFGFSASKVNGPAIAYQFPYLSSFSAAAATTNNVVSDVSWHHYYGDGPDYNAADFYSTALMDELIPQLQGAQAAAAPLTSTGSKLWLGETSSTYNGGTPGASAAYAAGFLWLDKLGLAALFGNSAVCRQDFFGGNYGLFSPNTTYPDYWTSVIFKQLVGSSVLHVTNSTALGRKTRVYAFCSKNITGGVVVVALNINANNASFVFQSDFAMFPRLEYHLTAPDNNPSSQSIQLNGQTLVATESGALPSLTPLNVDEDMPITMQGISYGFFVFPAANAPACS